MADETVIITSPGLTTWNSGIFGDGSFGGFELSLGTLQGSVTFSIDSTVSVTGTQLAVVESLTFGIQIDGNVFVNADEDHNLLIFSPTGSTVAASANLTVTGSQINLGEGFVTTEYQPDAGWGIAGWGIVPWGEEDDVIVPLTGTQINVAQNSVVIELITPINVIGTQVNLLINGVTEDIRTDAFVTGSQLNASQTGVTTTADSDVNTTGVQINTLIGDESITGDANINLIGIQNNLFITPVTPNADSNLSVTGSQINLDEGSVTTDFQPDAGWGVSGWGDVPWGLENDIIVTINEGPLAVVEGFTFAIQIDGNISINVQDEHNLLIFAPNGITTAADANVNVTGSQLNITEGLAGAIITADANVNVTGSQVNFTVGQVEAFQNTPVDVTGTQINVLIGNEDTSAGANVNVTGSQINFNTGQVTIAFGYDVLGSRINLIAGQATATGNATVNVTGIRLNTTAGSVNIQAWAEVQTGANNIWTPVDLAA
jgi:hypothetical protein